MTTENAVYVLASGGKIEHRDKKKAGGYFMGTARPAADTANIGTVAK